MSTMGVTTNYYGKLLRKIGHSKYKSGLVWKKKLNNRKITMEQSGLNYKWFRINKN